MRLPSSVMPVETEQLPTRAAGKGRDSPPKGGAHKWRVADAESLVYIIDDDLATREGVKTLLMSAGLRVDTSCAPQEFLSHLSPDRPAVAILEVCLRGMSGLTLQQELIRMGNRMPLIFIAEHVNIRTTVQAMKAGAVDFLTKPVRGQELLDAVREALGLDRAERSKRKELDEIRHRLESLTVRERDVMTYVVYGLLNKQIAALLGTSEITIKVHRAHVMRKMAAETLADLVRMDERLGT